MTTLLGVDPGLSGALALIGPAGLRIIDMPTLQPGKRRIIDEVELARLIDAAGPIDRAYLELVATRPGEGAVGAFAFGKGYGLIRGILRAHFIPIVDIAPRRWKAAVGIPAGAGKDASRAKAKDIFQREAGAFARVKDDGRAEAALIAHYGVMSLGEKVAA